MSTDCDRAVESCVTAQTMIDISADHLIGLRTECSNVRMSAMVQQEIRALESKLIKQFSRQLVAKRRCPDAAKLTPYPQLRQWLRVVGLSTETIDVLTSKMGTFEEQLEMEESEMKEVLREAQSSEEEIRRMVTALRNLRMFTEQSYNGKSTKEIHLHWDSWDRNQDSWDRSQDSWDRNQDQWDRNQDQWDRGQVSEMNGSTSNVSLAGCMRNGSSSSSSGMQVQRNGSNNSGMHSPRVDRNGSNNSGMQVQRNGSNNSGMHSPRVQRNHRPRASETDDSNSSLKCSPISPPQSSDSNCPFSPTLFQDDTAPLHHSPSSTSFPPGVNSSGVNPLEVNPDRSCSPPATFTKKSTSSSTGDGSRTPPPAKKHQTLLSEPFPLTKSKSHEEHLSNRIQIDPIRDQISGVVGSNSFNSLPHSSYRRRLRTEPGLRSTSPMVSPSRSPPMVVSPETPNQTDSCFDDVSNSNLIPPKSPQPRSPQPRSPQPRSPQPKSPQARSPQARAGMVHVIHHRFTKTVKVTSVSCFLCDKPMYIGYKCKDCKYRCHNTCLDKVPPSCGLPPELLQVYKETIEQREQRGSATGHSEQRSSCHSEQRSSGHSGVPNSSSEITSPSSLKSEPRSGKRTVESRRSKKPNGSHEESQRPRMTVHQSFRGTDSESQRPRMTVHQSFRGGTDSSSNTSSCTSSAPSSPAVILINTSPVLPTPLSASQVDSFHFPDVSSLSGHSLPGHSLTGHHNLSPLPGHHNLSSLPGHHSLGNLNPLPGSPVNEVVDTQKSNDSDKTVSITSGSTDSEKTLASRLNSQDSVMSDMVEMNEKAGWPRQNSLTAKEWEIQFEEVTVGEKIGTGRFGVVYKGQWHGAVAVKMLNMGHDVDQRQYMEAFKQEVATLRKTRHENLVLFMGACPPKLAIVTSLCKGDTLFTLLHLKGHKFPANRALLIAQQICQGMSYLHARDIVHKDLKSKNVFYENGKVIITDFGLLNVTRMCQGNRKGDWLTIPNGWLCYLSPEIMRCLRPGDQQNEALPFTSSSDVFAFGTLWFELLYGEWPFKGYLPEVIIWQVGSGYKPALCNLQASKEIKDLLMVCWEFNHQKRPEFSRLLETLTKLPKKRLQRSPSHPVQMLRSAESNF